MVYLKGGNILTRRRFLGDIAVGAVGSTFAVRQGLDDIVLAALPVQARRITFEEARTDKENKKGLRQKYIDQVVKEELGDESHLYIDSFIYDHNGQQALDYSASIRVSNLRSPAKIKPIKDSMWLEFLDLARKNSQYKGISERELKPMFDRYFDAELQKFIEKETMRDRIDTLNQIRKSYAFGIYSDFAQSKKTRFFMWDRIFDNVEEARSRFGKDYPGEDLVKMVIHHEYLHAKHGFHGIRFGNSLVLNSSRYEQFSQSAISFVLETEAHLNETDFAKKKFGAEHFRYKAAAISYAWHVYTTMIAPDTRIEDTAYTPAERIYIRHQKQAIRESAVRHPDVARVLELGRK